MELLGTLMKPCWSQLGPTRPGLYRILFGLDRTWPGFEPNLGIGNMKFIVFPLDFVGFMHVWEMFVFMHSWGHICDNRSPLGTKLSLIWSVLGSTSPISGSTWAYLSLSCHPLGPSSGQIGANLAQLASTWPYLGSFCLCFGRLLKSRTLRKVA